MIVTLVVSWLSTGAGADDLGRDDPAGAQELADKYAPVMMVKSQEQACDPDGEPYGPTAIDIVLDNPEVLLRQLGTGNPVVMRGPGAGDLFRLGEGMYLDFPGGALQPGCIYETDFNRYSEDLPAVVYAHIVQQEDRPNLLAVQYWFYWYYNDWNNKHESDWEGIQVLFEASSIAEALEGEPVSVGYAQHEGGERADWDASKLERDGSRPLVYSSAGSHASYYGSALYMGRSGSEGFGCDNTDGPSDRLDPVVVVLPDSVDDPADDLAWLAFEGRWGERQSGPFNGPTGPAAKERWLEPITWHDDLRPASVVIPAGDSDGLGVISAFCEVVEWGSGTLIQLTTSPIRLLFTALLGFVLARWLVRRTVWSRVALLPLVRRRRAGEIIRAATSAYRRGAREMLAFGLVYIPTAFIVGLLGALFAVLPLIRDVLDLAPESKGANLVLAAFAGSFASLAGYVAVNAMVAIHLERRASADGWSAVDSAKHAWRRRHALTSGLVRSFAVVSVLLFSFVGIPWGIRQLVRYQFMPQAVMVDGLEGKEAMARSSDLVRGRWIHTAVMITVFNALLAFSSLAFGLIVLVVFTSLPLWLFSATTTLIYGVFTPLTATAQTLLYGDTVAEQLDTEPAESVVA